MSANAPTAISDSSSPPETQVDAWVRRELPDDYGVANPKLRTVMDALLDDSLEREPEGL